MKIVLKPLTNSVLILSGLTAAISATDAGIKKIYIGSGTTALIISNKEIVDMMTIVDFFKESGLLIKAISETIKYESKIKKMVLAECY